MTRNAGLAVCLVLLSTSPRLGAASPIGYADPLRLPSLSHGTTGIRIPRSAWIALAVGGVLARESLRRENADEAAYVLERGALDDPADFGNVWGNGLTMAAGSAALFGLGVLSHKPSLREAGRDLGTAFLATSAVVLPMKMFVDRTRPDGGSYSFPSGHTAVAFAAAPVLSAHFGLKIGVPAYALAGMTALGRMQDRKHYLSDVVFGGAVGLAVGLTVVRSASSSRAPELALTGRGASITAHF